MERTELIEVVEKVLSDFAFPEEWYKKGEWRDILFELGKSLGVEESELKDLVGDVYLPEILRQIELSLIHI